MVVIFVGDRPSKANLSPSVAFVGTRSHAAVIRWTRVLKVKEYFLINRTDPYFSICMLVSRVHGQPVVALGREAEKAVKKQGIPCFYLPHPSRRNRILNDKKRLEDLLSKCSQWLREKERSFSCSASR